MVTKKAKMPGIVEQMAIQGCIMEDSGSSQNVRSLCDDGVGNLQCVSLIVDTSTACGVASVWMIGVAPSVSLCSGYLCLSAWLEMLRLSRLMESEELNPV